MKLKRIGIVVLALTGVIFAAPTAIKIGMLAAPLITGGAVMVVTPTGQVTVAGIGSGIALTSNNQGGWTLSAAGGAHVVGEKPARNADGSYSVALQVSGSLLAVYRNGVRQASPDDYTFDLALQKIVPAPAAGWQSDDLVVVDYVR